MWKNKVIEIFTAILKEFLAKGYELSDILDWRNVTPENVTELVDWGARTDYVDYHGRNLLARAAAGGAKPGTLRLLHEKYGISADAKDRKRLQPWQHVTVRTPMDKICKNVLKSMCDCPNREPVAHYGDGNAQDTGRDYTRS